MKNAKKEQLLIALLSNPTIKAAAKAAGVPESTIYNYLNDEDFSKEYAQRKRAAVQSAADYLQSRVQSATEIINAIMENELTPPQVRVSACRTVLEYHYRVLEIQEIKDRLTQLESLTDGV
jgi:AcrR family transcriptional regulator